MLGLDVEAKQLVCEDQDAHRDEHEPGDDLNRGVVTAKEREAPLSAVEGDRRQQERDSESRGVRRQQQRCMSGSGGRLGEAEDRP